MDSEEDDISLFSSKLGTKQHWDEAYKRELINFKESGDVGEIWFGDKCQTRIVKWLCSKVDITKQDKVIDLGCGNAALLVQLAERGFENLTGVDYCESAVSLSKKVCKDAGYDSISLEVCDILSEPQKSLTLKKQYRVCLDKGTFDAISLMEDKSVRKKYRSLVHKLLVHDGYFLITSCNWTAEELKDFFGRDFSVHSEIPAPTFTFGNKTGATVSSLIFTKVSPSS